MRVVVNASPLIILSKSGLADLLPQLCDEVFVPQAVWTEVLAGDDIAARVLESATWARLTAIEITEPTIIEWNLGAGESEVLSLALTLPGCRAMVDDRAARACARTLQIATLGTGGLLVRAKRQGLLASVTDALQKVSDAGLWLSDEVKRLLKEQAGE